MSNHPSGQTDALKPPLPVRLLAHLELLRLPNIFTAAADVMMGFLFAQPPLDGGRLPSQFGPQLGLLVTASCLLYAAGTVLNDVVDARVDARGSGRERPIPSGRVTQNTARRLGVVLLGAGAAVGWTASAWFGAPRTALLTTLLAACVLLYDGRLKRSAAGPLAMGACRMLNVLLGMSLTPTTWAGSNWLVAAGIGTYVVGVTWLARTEARTSGRTTLAVATLILLAGMGLIAWLPAWLPAQRLPIHVAADRWRLFWVLLAALIGWRCLRAVWLPAPALVQRAVRNAIHGLVVIDAAICFAVQGPFWALVVLTLILPTVGLGRWFAST